MKRVTAKTEAAAKWKASLGSSASSLVVVAPKVVAKMPKELELVAARAFAPQVKGARLSEPSDGRLRLEYVLGGKVMRSSVSFEKFGYEEALKRALRRFFFVEK